MRRVAQTVVPVAGLLAQTATTLTEHEVKQLRVIAQQPGPGGRGADAVGGPVRRVHARAGPDLDRAAAAAGPVRPVRHPAGAGHAAPDAERSTASELARKLVGASGLDVLQEVLGTLFFERSEVLKSRSALLAVDALVRQRPVAGAAALAGEVEQIIAGAHPFNELRVLSSLRAGWVVRQAGGARRPRAGDRRGRRTVSPPGWAAAGR